MNLSMDSINQSARESVNILFNFPEVAACESIETDQSRIDDFVSKLQNLPEGSREYKHCKMIIANMYRNMINNACYNGSSEDITQYVSNFFEYFDFNNQSSYADVVDALSYIIVFDIHDAMITKLPCNDSLIMTLYQYISSGRLKTSVKNDLKYPDQYHIFMDALCNKVTCDDIISYINNEWYESNSDMYWYNTSQPICCWIGLAVLKMLSCPSSKMKKCKYFPKNVI